MGRLVLKSLFGELVPTPVKPGSVMPEFAATAVLESTDTRVTDDGRMLDRHQQDLFVNGSPAAAMRAHLAGTKHVPEVRTITLLDPTRLWAPGVVKALSDATGQPVERLHLREQSTLRILATLERTIVPRRGDATLKIYHADLRVAEGENLAIPFVLMERSQMAAVIVGPMVLEEVEAMLQALRTAVREPSWNCDTLLFLLPPNALWIAGKIASIGWPTSLHVEVLDEPLTGTSSVWNALLAAWDRLQGSGDQSADPAAVDARNVARHLRMVMMTDGVLGVALADANDGDLLAGESRSNAVDLARASAALAPVLRAHRLAHDAMGLPGTLEEFTVAAGTSYHLVRPLMRRPNQFLFARLERSHANLALLKFKLAEAERNLG
ncbi:MAG: hypothetical protein OEU94_13755 [Aquincola sp.]|nr:hypothetical protein [Aquincola sp.]